MSNDAFSWTALLGRPQTLTMGGYLAGASFAGDNFRISQEAENARISRGALT